MKSNLKNQYPRNYLTSRVPEDIGATMYRWMSDLFPYNRSLTGDGVRNSLKYLKNLVPSLSVHEIPSGTKVFDWTVPMEWKIEKAYIANDKGEILVNFSDNNLHVVGYSIPINAILSAEELAPHLHSLPENPTAVPYVTSYYNQTWGFCIREDERHLFSSGKFHVVIESSLFEGSLTYGEIVIPGLSSDEIFLSTYICHPSMASNELSGPVIATAIAKLFSENYKLYHTLRIVFVPETIGALVYLNKNLKYLREHVKSGWVLTCLGDDNSFSYLSTRQEGTLTDRVSKLALNTITENWKLYSYLERGSDERQYCAPGVDLAMGSIMRSKYDEYSEYHTSLDNLEYCSPRGLEGGLLAIYTAIMALDKNFIPLISTIGEPQLGKRGLYPTLSTKDSFAQIQDLINVIAYSDGKNSVIDLCEKTSIKIDKVFRILDELKSHDLIIKVE